MNNNKKTMAIADIPFNPLTDREHSIINMERKRNLFNAFSKRAVISVIAAAIIMILEYIGKFNAKNLQAIPGEFTFIIIALIIFNILSYGAIILKRNMALYGEHMSSVYGTVVEKYDNHTLSKQNKQKSKNYIIFDTENIHCSTALPVSDINDFKKITVGEQVLIVKYMKYGNETYELFTYAEQPDVE